MEKSSFILKVGNLTSIKLILGENIRDWRRGTIAGSVTTVTSPDVSDAVNGIGFDGGPGGMDLLKIILPTEYQGQTIDSIRIVDTTLETTGTFDPGMHILAVTVEIKEPR